MRVMKFYLIAILASIFCGCGLMQVDYADNYVSYCIENESEKIFLLYVESAPEEYHLMAGGSVPMGETIYPLQCNKWIDRGTSIGEEIFVDGNFTFTMHFKNGVKHTFVGDLIENDFRNISSWQVEQTTEHNGNVPHTIYTYTFTDADYERIMALHDGEGGE